jgi:hypothetical protein
MGRLGGFTLTIKNSAYPFESRMSWPNGGFNRLSISNEDGLEESWGVNVKPAGKDRYEVKAGGDFYTIQRQIEVFPTHVYIKDTYTNTGKEDLGLLIYNETPLKPGQVTSSLLCGWERFGRPPDKHYPDYSQSVFFTDANTGIGMVPVDSMRFLS